MGTINLWKGFTGKKYSFPNQLLNWTVVDIVKKLDPFFSRSFVFNKDILKSRCLSSSPKITSCSVL